MNCAALRRAPLHPSWAAAAVVHTHALATWWDTIHGPYRRTSRSRVRVAGNVVHLPPPIAGYRIRHNGTAAVVELKPSHAPAIIIGHCADLAAARALLTSVFEEHARPILGEIGRAAA